MRHGLIALAAVVGSLMAVSAAPAMGAVHWSDTSKGIKVSGPLTAYKNGGSAKTCTANVNQSYELEEASAVIWTTIFPALRHLFFNCAGGGSLAIVFYLDAVDTDTVLVGESFPNVTSPWGGYYNQTTEGESRIVADFANGSGGTSSTLSFSNDQLGVTNDEQHHPITISGTLKVMNSSGGLLTLLP